MDEDSGVGGIHPVHDPQHKSISATKHSGTAVGPGEGTSKGSVDEEVLSREESRRYWTTSDAMSNGFTPLLCLVAWHRAQECSSDWSDLGLRTPGRRGAADQ